MSLQSVRTQASPGVAGMTVGVKGTSNRTNVDGNGRFTLNDVPNGHVDLEFSGGSGFNSSVGLDDVQSAENITLSLSLTDSSVVLESAQRNAGSAVQLEARVEAVHGMADDDVHQRGSRQCIEVRVQRVHVDESILMAGESDRIDPDKWRPLIMSFQQFYGLGSKVHESALGTVPESAYRGPDIARARQARR